VTSARLRMQLEGAIQAVVVALVVWLGLAASNIRPWNIPVGRTVRWAALAELAVLAIALAVVARTRARPGPLAGVVAAFVALALASALWSPDPGQTFGRSLGLLVAFVASGALALAALRQPLLAEYVVLALLAGVLLLAVGGLVGLWYDADRAIVPATTQSPARYTGLGGNPNMMAMLIALVTPAAVWALTEARSWGGRAIAAGGLMLLYGSLVASGSRGALVGALLGTLVFALGAGSTRLRIAGVAVALFVLGVGLMQLPQPSETNPVIRYDIVPPATPPLGPADAQARLPLESEIGFPAPGDDPFRRSLFTSSGRLDAWRGALDQARERPVAGYGFGTEDGVFADRYYLHYSALVENSYLGTLLQLGLVGLGLLLAALVLLAARALAHDRFPASIRGAAAACAGAVVCGLFLAFSQSFLTSVGSPAMIPFWLCAFLLVGVTSRASRASGSVERGRDGERDQREHEPAEGHGEASLDVMRAEHERVEGEQHDDAPARAAAGDGDR
jgi:O-Antigen ligase